MYPRVQSKKSALSVSTVRCSGFPISGVDQMFAKEPLKDYFSAPFQTPTQPHLYAVPSKLAPAVTIIPEPKDLVAIIGTGYVGQSLIDGFATAFDVIGFDISDEVVSRLSTKYRANSRVRFTTRPEDLARAHAFLIAVPTLLLPDRTIDTSALQSVLAILRKHASRGSIVVVESSVSVGMTRRLLGALAAEKGLYVGMSPERIDPGRTSPTALEIPKVVSGLDDATPGALAIITALYRRVFTTVVPVSKPEVAEMTKLYENCQRMVCIAYANEMADACRSLPDAVDPREVCAAAATKPFGYMPFAPGLGVGGHCIPVNPWYLLGGDAGGDGYSEMPLLRAAAETTARRPRDMAKRILNGLGDPVLGDESVKRDALTLDRVPRVLVAGVAFKKGQSLLDFSPGVDLARGLQEQGNVEVLYADALVPQERLADVAKLPDHSFTAEVLDTFDVIVVAFKQVGMDFGVLDRLKKARVEIWGN